MTDNTPTELVSFHLKISNRLSGLSWNRSDIWDARTSVHDWSFIPGLVIGFDAVPRPNSTTLTLVVRQTEWVSRVRSALTVSKLPTPPVNVQRPERMLVGSFLGTDGMDLDLLATKVASAIVETRTVLEDLLRLTDVWHDAETGIDIRTSEKSERKGCQELIFIFTSIRSHHGWLDFKGPNGTAIQTNRARIVYIEDAFTADYTYNLAINGNRDVHAATVRFIRNYVVLNGFSWNSVTLAGMSKGGTTALIIGANLPSCTVLALAPQLLLGNYLLHNRGSILRNITGLEPGEPAKVCVDELMWDCIPYGQGEKGVTHCYILTSTGDLDCVDGLDNLTERFDDPSRVLLFVDDSGNTPNHLQTVHFLSPLFLSLLGVISSGIRPRSWSYNSASMCRGGTA